MSRQIPLDLTLPRSPGLTDFLPGPNAEALAAVKAAAEPYLYLWGGEGTGKTHLLLGACREADASGKSALYLDLDRRQELDPAMLEGLERLDLVCLDDVQSIGGDEDWERALFDLFNRLREADRRLIAAGSVPAAELPLELPDLRSRLTWGPGFRLRSPDDETRLELLQSAAGARGMQLSEAAARYILNHCPRDLHSLEKLLDRLDAVTLAEKRKPSIALIQKALDVEDEP